MSIRNDTYIIDANGSVDIAWAGLLNGDSGSLVTIGRDYWKFTMQVVGTFGAGGTILLEGSNDGTNFTTVKDVNNAAVSVIDTSMIRVEGIPRYLRPRASAGDGTTNLSVLLHGVI